MCGPAVFLAEVKVRLLEVEGMKTDLHVEKHGAQSVNTGSKSRGRRWHGQMEGWMGKAARLHGDCCECRDEPVEGDWGPGFTHSTAVRLRQAP